MPASQCMLMLETAGVGLPPSSQLRSDCLLLLWQLLLLCTLPQAAALAAVLTAVLAAPLGAAREGDAADHPSALLPPAGLFGKKPEPVVVQEEEEEEQVVEEEQEEEVVVQKPAGLGSFFSFGKKAAPVQQEEEEEEQVGGVGLPGWMLWLAASTDRKLWTDSSHVSRVAARGVVMPAACACSEYEHEHAGASSSMRSAAAPGKQ